MNELLLAQIPLFADLPLAELRALLSSLEVLESEPGALLCREGDPSDSFFIVVDGELEVLMAAGSPEEMLLNMIGPGEYFGEMGLLVPGGQRSASVRARSKVVSLALRQSEFAELLRRQPMLAYAMVRVLSERLDATNTATFQDLTEKNRQLQLAYDELKAAQEQLVEKERLERELQVAARIQTSILPETLPACPACDFGALMVPARMVGGDFYDVFPLGDDRFGVVIGDVADKGVPSAIFMARAHALIAAEAARGGDPAAVLRQVNLTLTHIEKSTQFVTAIYGIIEAATGDFACVRAGHEPPLLLHPDGRVERIPHKTGQPLGLFEGIILDENMIRLEPGASLLLYTDGLTDCRDPQGTPFGLDRVKDVFRDMPGQSGQEICDRILLALREFQQGAPQDDDVTLVALHVV
ncbi:MAG: SpoIIE family protein phosphatase [Chloroflexota bacterium]